MVRIVLLTLVLLSGLFATAEAAAPDGDTRKWCMLFFNRAKPGQVIVCDKDGVYMHRVRQVEMWYQVGGTSLPVLRLHSWDGVYEPAAAQVEHQECLCLSQETIEPEQFTAIINGTKAIVPAKGK